MTENVSAIQESGLCVGCGVCAGLCPADAIRMSEDLQNGTLKATVDEDSCARCGMCVAVCPGHSIPLVSLMSGMHGGSGATLPLGPSVSSWRGNAADHSLRARGSSGGLVTSLLAHAIQSKRADGVLVTRMNGGNPLRPEPFIARSVTEIIDSSGSKYCPVPVGTALREILEGQGRYIFVGLPCHVHGLRKAQAADARLRERIVLCVSLVCHHTPSYRALDFLLEGLGVERDEVARLDFRQGVWPGSMSIHLKDGRTREVPYGSDLYWGMAFMSLFPHPRCELCLDKMSVLSDVSFMDSWRIAKPGDTAGTGIALCRTSEGDEMLRSAIASGAIVADPVPLESVAIAQEAQIHFRQRASSLVSAAARGKPIPNYDFDVSKSVGQATKNRMTDRLARSVAGRRRYWPLLRLYMRIRRSLKRAVAR